MIEVTSTLLPKNLNYTAFTFQEKLGMAKTNVKFYIAEEKGTGNLNAVIVSTNPVFKYCQSSNFVPY